MKTYTLEEDFDELQRLPYESNRAIAKEFCEESFKGTLNMEAHIDIITDLLNLAVYNHIILQKKEQETQFQKLLELTKEQDATT